jgi:flagellar hook-associated protein 2
MGTVGLSFGSPTSGTGFDVSATVSQIVANLQNVETPWKNQLTTLKSQDTALSSMGTLLSAVSTDLGNLTEFTGVMAQKTGSSSDNNVVQLTNATSSATAGTHTISVTSLATTSSGYLDPIGASDQLSGSISIQVGSGKAHVVSVSSSNQTLAGLQAAINAAGIGVTASVLTDSKGSRLSLVSGTSGDNGKLTVTSSITDTSAKASLSYNPVTTGADASLNVDGVDLHSASNTVTNLIAGVTFQLLAPSAVGSDGTTREPVQVIIGNDNNGVETAINQFVTDYNALVAAINTQQGNDSSGNPEPLFGSPTLSLLQQQLMTVANAQNPNGYIDPITTGSTLSGSMSLAVGGGVTDTIVIGAGTNTANTFYTGAGVDTLQGVADAINAANSGTTLGFTSTGQTGGTLPVVATGNALSGSITLTLGNGADATTENVVMGDEPAAGPAADTIYTGSSSLTLSQLASTINGTPAFGVTANVTTDANGLQTLSLASKDGTSSLNVNSSILAAGPGVTANIVTSNGQSTLTLKSQTAGSAGALDVQSNLVAASGSTNTSLNYNSSSDLSTLANLGITVSTKDDGTLTFDQSTLDAALNEDFGGVLGFFQNANSWGQTVTAILNNMGTSSTKGVLSLAEKSNSNIEATLNADISKQDASIATQKTKLTAELNLANQILQELPNQLNGMNELYSAISGYNQNKG